MTSATTGHATCRRGNSVWPSTTLTIARAMRSRARMPRRRRPSRSRSGGSALARGPVVGGPLKGLFNARMSPRGVTGVSNYGLSRFHDILDVLHHDDHFASIARAILFKGAGLAEIATPLLILVMSASDLERLTINTIRTLAMDAVQAAKSGHPGTPMAMAPVVYCLWQEFLRFDPDDPIWPNRDRFVLSMGHASMLLYSMLALAGVKAGEAQYEPLGPPPHCGYPPFSPWPRSSPFWGGFPCVSLPPFLSGRPGFGSCSGGATPRCCSIRCSRSRESRR